MAEYNKNYMKLLEGKDKKKLQNDEKSNESDSEDFK
jgi:hypothetical protein